jgi:putative endopeptidase
MKNLVFIVLASFALNACQTPTPAEKKFVEIEGIDSTVKPGDNFFMYVNGIWYDSAKIPSTQAGVGAYMFMNYPQRLRMQGILDSVSQTNSPVGSIEQQVGDFYASGMDTVTINQRGYDPINPILLRIEDISDVPSLIQFVATEAKNYNTSVISFNIGPDDKNSRMNIAHARQTGIGLPDRDYYFKTDPSTMDIQDAYKKYLTSLFELTGNDPETSAKDAGLVYNIDKQIASSHKTRVERRDVKANYNKLAVTDLEKRQPNIGWQNLLNGLGAQTDSIDVGQLAYYDKLNELLQSIPINDWKVYLRANTISNYADDLSNPFVIADFEFTKVLRCPRWRSYRGRLKGLQPCSA